MTNGIQSRLRKQFAAVKPWPLPQFQKLVLGHDAKIAEIVHAWLHRHVLLD